MNSVHVLLAGYPTPQPDFAEHTITWSRVRPEETILDPIEHNPSIQCLVIGDHAETSPLALLKTVRKYHSSIPVILYTDQLSPAEIETAYDHAVSDVIPVRDTDQTEILATRIRRAVRGPASTPPESTTFDRDALEVVKAALDEAPHQLTILEPNGDIFYTNSSFISQPATHLTPQPDTTNYFDHCQTVSGPATDAVQTGVQDVLDGQRATFTIEYLDDEAGEPRWLLLNAEPIPVNGEMYAILTHTEVTRLKQRIDVLNRVLRHNMRNKLNIIDGYTHNLSEELSDEAAAAITRVHEATKAVLETSEKLRTVDAELGRSTQQPVDVVSLLEDAVRSITTEHHDVTITCSLPDEQRVYADTALQTAFEEVLENAIQHGDIPPADTEITVTLRYPDTAEDMIEILITDNGTGVSATEKGLVTGNRPITQLQHGQGLGLWFVKWLVDRFDGEFILENETDSGTKARIRLHKKY